MDTEAFERAGLYDPSSPRAAERLELLEFLVGEGVSLERMVEAKASYGLTGAAGDNVLRPGEPITLPELAALVDATPDDVARILLAVGFPVDDPDASAFRPSDAEALVAYQFGAALFGDEPMLQFLRVIGSSLARIAEAAVWLFLENVEQPITEAAQGEAVLAKANLDAVNAFDAHPYRHGQALPRPCRNGHP